MFMSTSALYYIRCVHDVGHIQEDEIHQTYSSPTLCLWFQRNQP